MGMFANIKDAKASFDNNYFRDGHYIWQILNIKADKNRKGIPYIAVECKVIHVFDDSAGTGHKLREEAAWVLTSDKDSFLGNIKAFVSHTVGCDANDVTEEGCDALCGPSQPLAGFFVESHNRTQVAKSGKPFCKVGWKRSWTEEEVKELVGAEQWAVLFGVPAAVE